MTTHTPPCRAASSQSSQPLQCDDAHQPSAAGPASAHVAHLGGNTVARIVGDHCPDTLAAGVVIEYLDAKAGIWEFSLDQGRSWRGVRTDLINRAGNLGLALDCDARLRVLPVGGRRINGARVAFHTVQRSHAQGNGSYRAYVREDREGRGERDEGSPTVTLVLSLAAINGMGPLVQVPRPRHKRAAARPVAAADDTAGVHATVLV